jgi:hypothetical protein
MAFPIQAERHPQPLPVQLVAELAEKNDGAPVQVLADG